jgi:hypothetical protein
MSVGITLPMSMSIFRLSSLKRCLLIWQKTAVLRGYSVVESWISHGWFVVTPILRPVKITMSFVLYSKEIKPAREQYRINPGMTRISALFVQKGSAHPEVDCRPPAGFKVFSLTVSYHPLTLC